MRVPNHELMPAITQDALSQGAQARFTVSGGSMRPFLRDGATVTVAPYGAVRVRRGDIALARRADGSYVLHRVARVDGAQLWLLGDAQGEPEGPFALDQVFGRVIRVQQRGRTISVEHPVWRTVGLLWLTLRPGRRYLWRLEAYARRLHRFLRGKARRG